jgi:hypothetical protein
MQGTGGSVVADLLLGFGQESGKINRLTPMNKNLKATRILKASRRFILNSLRRVIINRTFNYRTFGTEIEDYLSDILVEIFKKRRIIKTDKDYALAPDKNYFPDFELKVKPPLAIDYKTGNASKLSDGKWVNCKNSNNDLGTLNSWPKKIKKFGGDNIYYIFVVYNFNTNQKKIVDVQIAPFYEFVGLNRVGVLRYREKDGNLRPKDFFVRPLISSFTKFSNLLEKTIAFRSKRIIIKHQTILRSLGLKE